MAENTQTNVGAAAKESAPAQTKRDKFRARMQSRYPDLNMDDEDAYYEQAGKTLDEYEGYENGSKKLRESMQNSPAMLEMLSAARNQDNFDPVVWLVENSGLDLDALSSDPDYAKKLADARSTYVEKQSRGKELESAMEQNMPTSAENIKKKAEELGLDEQKTTEIVGQMYQVMDDLLHGIISPEIFELLAKGGNYDTAVSEARDEGKAEGINQNITEKLRKDIGSGERVSGSQTPMRSDHKPANRQRNMFLEGDEDEDY